MFHRAYKSIAAATIFLFVAAGVATPTTAANVSAAASKPSPAAKSRQITLITGDVVRLSTAPGGRQRAEVFPRNSLGPSRQFQTFNLGRDLYVVPQSAMPYLGTTLDPKLFDVTKLAQAPITTIPMTLRSSAAPVQIPGIRIAHRSGTTARGVPESGVAFGAALGRQWLADHNSATHTSGLFAAVTRIGARTSARPARQSTTAMHNVTVNGIDATGNKDTGDAAFLLNVDDLNRFNEGGVFSDGTATATVPDGHYMAIADFADPTTGAAHVAEIPQFTVARDTAITLDGRDATSRVSVTTPRPVTAAVSDLTIGRTDATGATGTVTFEGETGVTFFVQPTTKPVTVGALHYAFYTRLLSPTSAAMPYSYDLKFFHDNAIPADQHYAAGPANLATVDAKYAASHSGQAAYTTEFSALPWDENELGFATPLTVPNHRTEYFTAAPTVVWQSDYTSVFLPFNPLGDYSNTPRSYAPGEQLSTVWGAPPGHPVLDTSPTNTGNQTICPACISGNQVNLVALPFSDSSPDHIGPADPSGDTGLTETLQYSLLADDTPIGSGSFLETDATLPSNTKRLTVGFDTTRFSRDFLLSTAVQTRWTIPTTAPTTALPATWSCSDFPDFPTRCRVLPLTTINYQLPVNLLGELRPGPQSGTAQLGHLGQPADVPFRSVEMRVSYDGGQTWNPVPVVHHHDGNYGISLTVPVLQKGSATQNGFGALRISTRDAAGGTFDQTIQHAFRIAPK